MPSECTCSKCAQICMCVWTSPLSVISPAAVASHAENWHGSPTWGGKFTWLLVWFYIITLTVTHFTGENWRRELARLLSSSRRAQARLVMQTSRQLIYKWSESMIQPWEEKKNRKTCSCPSEFHWHGALYRADWTSEWRERESEFRLVSNSTVVPPGYSCGHTRSHCDNHFIDLALQYLPFSSCTQQKTHLFPVSLARPATYGAILKTTKERCWKLTLHLPMNLSSCVHLQRHTSA